MARSYDTAHAHVAASALLIVAFAWPSRGG